MYNAKKRKRSSLLSSNNGDLTQRQFYINGLDFETTNQNLRTIFSQYSNSAAAAAAEDNDITRRKIYAVGVPCDMPAWKLLEHFMLYGEVEEGPLGYHLGTGRSSGYAVFVYKTAAGAAAALRDPVKIIDGKQLYCKAH